MGVILNREGKPITEDQDVNLKPGQWMMHLEMDLATDEIAVSQDLGNVPAKTYEQKKTSEDNNFTTLCNAIAQIAGHFIKSGITREYVVKRITDAVVHGIMPAEEAWKAQGGLWKLHLLYQPTTGQMAIHRDKHLDKPNKTVNEEKDAVNKDFYLLCRSMHTFIQHLIAPELPAEKMCDALIDTIDVYLAVGRMSGQRAKIEVTAVNKIDHMKYKKLLQEVQGFMQRILPKHYNCTITNKQNGVRCVSSKGIEDEEKWNYIFLAVQQTYGTRFQEIYHNTCTNHVDFIVYLK